MSVSHRARWEIELDRAPLAIAEHAVVPFSAGVADLYLEAANGRLTGELRVEAGTVWRGTRGWQPEVRAEASIERTVMAINDRARAPTLTSRLRSLLLRRSLLLGRGLGGCLGL